MIHQFQLRLVKRNENILDKLVKAIVTPTKLYGESCKMKAEILTQNVTFLGGMGKYIAVSASLTNITPGTYYMVYDIEGMQSLRSEAIVFEVTQHISSFFPSSFETIWTCITLALILISNTLVLSKYFFIISILCILIEFIIIEQSSKGLIYQISSYIIFGILTMVIVYTFIEEYTTDDKGYFAKIRLESFRKYTIKMLFGSEKITLKVRVRMREQRLEYYTNKHAAKNDAPGSISKIISFFKTAWSLFQPFSSSTPDAFFFPQQLLASFIINIFFFTLIAIKLFQITMSVINRYYIVFIILVCPLY